MFLTNHCGVKEVLAFPFVKDVAENKEKAAEVVGIEPMPEEGSVSLYSLYGSH